MLLAAKPARVRWNGITLLAKPNFSSKVFYARENNGAFRRFAQHRRGANPKVTSAKVDSPTTKSCDTTASIQNDRCFDRTLPPYRPMGPLGRYFIHNGFYGAYYRQLRAHFFPRFLPVFLLQNYGGSYGKIKKIH
jgi:hypothetical protein